MIGPLPDRVRRVRTVTVTAARALTVSGAAGPYFNARLVAPRDNSTTDGSPRDRPPSALLWPAVGLAQAPPVLNAGDRIETVSLEQWELLEASRDLVHGDRVVARQAPVLRVATLYPFTAALQEQGGTVVTASMPVAVWPVGERDVVDRGEYQNFNGEAPAEHLAALEVKNRKLAIGGRNLKIASAVLDVDQPRVRLSLRRANG